MKIRKVRPDDLVAILQLFHETIEHVCASDYPPDQIKAWSAAGEDLPKWRHRLEDQYFLVAEIDKILVGFGSVYHGGHIDLLYVHKDYQKQGIAGRILSGLEKEAQNQGKVNLSAEVSITARPFFEKRGYIVLKEQMVRLKGVELINYIMQKNQS